MDEREGLLGDTWAKFILWNHLRFPKSAAFSRLREQSGLCSYFPQTEALQRELTLF